MDLFSTNVLTGTINSLLAPSQHLLDTYFPLVQTEASEEIHFDVIDKTRRLAPFVSPVLAGKIMESQGHTTKTFKPAYVKPKTPFDPARPLRRSAGERLGGVLSPATRLLKQIGQTMLDHRGMIDLRLEVMASEAMRLAQVTVEGENYPTQVVNFGRAPSLTVVKAGGAHWGEAGVKPLDDLQAWAQMVLKLSGAMPRVVTMDIDSWVIFREDETVKSRLDLLRATGGNSLNLGAQIKEGAVYMGNIDGFDIWVYSAWYADDAGVDQPILPSGTVIMGGPQIEGTRAFGAIRDEEIGFQAVEYFSKSWVEKDPSVRTVLTQSAPLIVPTRPNASLCATVL